MVFIFANTQKHSNTVEQNIGQCQFCNSPENTVDLVEHHAQTTFFGLFPTKEQVNRMVVCRKCKKSIKEEYYTMRSSKAKTEETAELPIQVADAVAVSNDNKQES